MVQLLLSTNWWHKQRGAHGGAQLALPHWTVALQLSQLQLPGGGTPPSAGIPGLLKWLVCTSYLRNPGAALLPMAHVNTATLIHHPLLTFVLLVIAGTLHTWPPHNRVQW